MSVHGTPVQQKPRATARNLERDYESARKYSGTVEAFRNFEQALVRQAGELRVVSGEFQGEAATFRLAVVPVEFVAPDGTTTVVLKNGYLNTAPRMSEGDMRTYFVTIGESGNETWSATERDKSYGQGLRQGELPSNRAGLFIISWDAEEPDNSRMMWLAYDKAKSATSLSISPAGSEVLDEGDEPTYLSDIVAPVGPITTPLGTFDPATLINEDLRKWGGMAFIRFGSSLEEHTAVTESPKGETWSSEVEARLGQGHLRRSTHHRRDRCALPGHRRRRRRPQGQGQRRHHLPHRQAVPAYPRRLVRPGGRAEHRADPP